ncbi:MAG: 30S ribosomal protein S8 [Candidatus Moraniibacteriota bacterium]
MDPISDMLTRIRNAYQRSLKVTQVPHSKMKRELAMVLVKYGYLRKLETAEIDKNKKMIKVYLKYKEGEPAILNIKRVSRGGQRRYSGIKKIERIGGRRGMIVLTTSKGILPHWEAKKQKAGGEILCVVY